MNEQSIILDRETSNVEPQGTNGDQVRRIDEAAKRIREGKSLSGLKDYEFVDRENAYALTCNGRVEKSYPKGRYSKREAEEFAANIVNKAYEKFGYSRVRYYGLLSEQDFKNHY